MSDDVAIADEQDRALARLLELGLAAAEKVQGRLMACEDDAQLGELTLALNRASRNVRQTVALQLRAARERRQEDRDAAAADDKVRETQVHNRRRHLQARLERLVWTEYEPGDDEGDELLERIGRRIEDDAFNDDFTTEPAEAQIARLCAEFGLGPAPAPAVPPNGHDADDGHWRSSA